jgi:adenosine deaminase CECR1
MATNNLKTDDGCNSINNEGIMNIISEEVEATILRLKKEGIYFGGLKVIYCTPRSFSRDDIRTALNECIDLKLKFPDLLCGGLLIFTT